MLFTHAVALIGTFLGGLSDIFNNREVPDWLNFGMVFVGIGSALIFSIAQSDKSIIIASIVGAAVCFALGYLMYYSGQWGGGDAKMLWGIGALVGLDVLNMTELPFLAIFMINLLLVGAIWGVAWSFYLMFKNWKTFKKKFHSLLYSREITFLRKLNIAVAFFLLLGIAFAPLNLKVMLFVAMCFLFLMLYTYVFTRSIEDCCMIKEVDIAKLTEGDWIYKDVKIRGKLICGPKDLGVSLEQIDELKNLKKKGLIKKIIIKEGIPFTATFFIAYFLTFHYGNWIMAIF